MATNLELKVKINSFTRILKKMKYIEASYRGILNQKDIYYRFKKGMLKLRIENGKYTLIKYLRDEKRKRWSNYYLLNLSGDNPERYLNELFYPEKVVEKKRKLFLYGNTRIHLDYVKNLGRFLELETLVVTNRKNAQKEFQEVVKLLDLNFKNQIRASYRNLI